MLRVVRLSPRRYLSHFSDVNVTYHFGENYQSRHTPMCFNFLTTQVEPHQGITEIPITDVPFLIVITLSSFIKIKFQFKNF